MIKIKSHVIVACISLTLVACNESDGFKGSAKSKDIVAAKADATPEPTADAKPAAPEPEIIAAEPSTVLTDVSAEEAVVAGVCREKLAYDPSEILCAIEEESSNTVWKHGQTWGTSWLANKKASWISPLAAKKQGDQDYCPFVPGAEKAVYVSHFKLDSDQEVTIEAIMDDIGQVRLWKNADSKKEIYISNRAPTAKGKVKLEKGFYTVVMDAVDTGAFASGAIATIFDASNKIIRQTQSSADWCIYRVKTETDIPEFLNSAAACKACMIGADAAAASAAH